MIVMGSGILLRRSWLVTCYRRLLDRWALRLDPGGPARRQKLDAYHAEADRLPGFLETLFP